MQHGMRWLAAALMVPCLGAWGCGDNSEFDNEAASDEGPARVEPIKGSDASRVILTPAAARRIGIQTAPAQDTSAGGTVRRTIPYTALLYDAQGKTFTYTNPSRLTYVRQGIEVQSIKGSVVLLRSGPPAGMPVVTVGAPELLGTEYGVEE
jgi:hypothetical protein